VESYIAASSSMVFAFSPNAESGNMTRKTTRNDLRNFILNLFGFSGLLSQEIIVQRLAGQSAYGFLKYFT
jgi:hypothetical protein